MTGVRKSISIVGVIVRRTKALKLTLNGSEDRMCKTESDRSHSDFASAVAHEMVSRPRGSGKQLLGQIPTDKGDNLEHNFSKYKTQC